jgi:hypothetical protein
MQAQELAAQTSRDAFEKKVLDKIEDDTSFLIGEVQAQKHDISALRTSVENISTEVTKLAEQVSLQNAFKAEASEQITTEHLDDIWHHLTALQEAVFVRTAPPCTDPFPPSIPDELLRPPQLTPPTAQPVLLTSQWIENPSYSPDLNPLYTVTS